MLTSSIMSMQNMHQRYIKDATQMKVQQCWIVQQCKKCTRLSKLWEYFNLNGSDSVICRLYSISWKWSFIQAGEQCTIGWPFIWTVTFFSSLSGPRIDVLIFWHFSVFLTLALRNSKNCLYST